MEQMNLHKQKLYALIIAAVGIIACLLPWWKVSAGIFGTHTENAMNNLGVLSFFGFVAAGVVTFIMGDKTRSYDGQVKLIAAACFGAGLLFALIQFIRQSSYTAIGIYLAILAGIAGAVLVYFIKPEQLESKKPM